MGCKCGNSTENEKEINKTFFEEGNDQNPPNDFNQNFDKGENLLGYNNNNQDNPENQNIPLSASDNPIQENKIDPNLKYENYSSEIVELINRIREDPVSYADVIEDSIQYIVEEEDKNDPTNKRLIFKKKVKVALNKGITAFKEAAEYLRSLSPLPRLEFASEKCMPLPENEDELQDPSFLKEQVKLVRLNSQVDVFFKDLIKIPEVSGLLMIVDDTNKNAGKKRLALLNKDLKYIGVNHKFIGKHFVAYFSFSK